MLGIGGSDGSVLSGRTTPSWKGHETTMRRGIRLLLAGVAGGALTMTAAAPVGAQEELGLETNILEGRPGEVVAGTVDTDDIAEHCVTDLEAFQARFQELLNIFSATGEGSLMSRFFPTDEFDFTNHEQLAFSATGLVVFGLAANFDGAAEEALPQTFVLTFADIATQEPVGEMGNFDPATGEGVVVVPDITPGQWAVAAACVGPVLDLDLLEAGIRENAAFLEELGAPVDPNSPEFQEFAEEFLGEEDASAIDFVTAVGPDLLEPIVTPDALGAVIFCILDRNGQCPNGPPPPGDGDEPGPALPVVLEPGFTG
jgi:hypothetical protein